MEKRDPHPAGAANRGLTGETTPRTRAAINDQERGTHGMVPSVSIQQARYKQRQRTNKPWEKLTQRGQSNVERATDVRRTTAIEGACLLCLIIRQKQSLCLSVIVNVIIIIRPDLLHLPCYICAPSALVPNPDRTQRYQPPSHRNDILVAHHAYHA
jgi:hypothetical protein